MTPNAKAHLFPTSLDPTGSKTLSFASATVRDTAFVDGTICPAASVIDCGTDFDYIRKDNVLKVGYNATYLDSLGINYCRYKEPTGCGDGYIYAFIDRIEYLAPNTSALHLRTDSFMTYQFNIGTTQAYIKRHTIPDDLYTLGSNRVNEPISGGNYKIYETRAGVTYSMKSAADFQSNFYIGLIVAPPEPKNGDVNYTAKNFLQTQGTVWLSGTPCGGTIILCDLTGTFGLRQTIRALEVLSCTVVATFIVPRTMCANHIQNRNQVITTYSSTLDETETFEWNFATANTMDDIIRAGQPIYQDATVRAGYSPRHKKCWQYPFSYVRAVDYSGASKMYKFEDSNYSEDGVPAIKFNEVYIVAPSGCICSYPTTMIQTDDPNDQLFYSVTYPQIPYLQSAYGQYLGSNNNSLIFNRLTDNISGGVSIAGTLWELGKYGFSQSKTTLKSVGKVAGGLYDIWEGVVEPRLSQLKAEQDINRTTLVNAPTGNTLMALNGWGIRFNAVGLVEADMARVDKYFDRYGYAIEAVQQVNYKACPDYDYVETSGMVVTGKIPLADKENIQKLFNAGITIWHNASRYGLYADADHPNNTTPT